MTDCGVNALTWVLFAGNIGAAVALGYVIRLLHEFVQKTRDDEAEIAGRLSGLPEEHHA